MYIKHTYTTWSHKHIYFRNYFSYNWPLKSELSHDFCIIEHRNEKKLRKKIISVKFNKTASIRISCFIEFVARKSICANAFSFDRIRDWVKCVNYVNSFTYSINELDTVKLSRKLKQEKKNWMKIERRNKLLLFLKLSIHTYYFLRFTCNRMSISLIFKLRVK